MLTDSHIEQVEQISEIEALLPDTWLPDLPLVERVKALIEPRRRLIGMIELLVVRIAALERQNRSMRAGYLRLLAYARRVGWLEQPVCALLKAADEKGAVRMSHVAAIHAARERFAEVEPVEPPLEALELLEPFLRGQKSTQRVMVTGQQLRALREVLRWVKVVAEE